MEIIDALVSLGAWTYQNPVIAVISATGVALGIAAIIGAIRRLFSRF